VAVEIAIATEQDIDTILLLIQELATFELEPDATTLTAADLMRDGFGSQPLFTCLVARDEGLAVGMSFCYIRYSTWKGPRLYLEDLIVTKAARGKGYGSALWKATLALAKELGCSAVCWQVLDWNKAAVDFYYAKGANIKQGWLDMEIAV
jgi:GNAT superfamily N-acetyltransferase